MSSVGPPAMSLPPLLFEDAFGAPPELRTLVDISRHRAEIAPHHLAYTFLLDGETTEANLTYRQLDVRARAIAAHLQKRGAEGERVLLVFDPGLDYVAAIIGCFYAGAIAVPVYPPDPFRLARTLPRLQAVVKNAEATFLLSTQTVLGDAGGPLWEVCGPGTIPLEHISNVECEDWRPLASDPRRIALLQYTSGSTGDPRGVTLTHANLMHNFSALFDVMYVPRAVGVHWLPPYHDMGLIGGVLLPLYAGRPTVLMSPLAFMQRPMRWLEAIHRYRGTTSGGPNFAYELCVRKIKPEECEGLDLRCWKVAVNGSEPVRADTLARFTQAFAPYGFCPETPFPAYGMAETTLIVTGTPTDKPPTVQAFVTRELEANRVRSTALDDPRGTQLVSCGPPALDVEIRIVDPETCRPVGSDAIGEIWVRSPSVGQGYWNRPEETAHTFRAMLTGEKNAAYLRTGDLGFLYDGELYVVGRLKDLIILAGRNFFPPDLERAVQEAHPALKTDGGAAFSVEGDQEERLVVVQEVARPRRVDLDEAIAAVRRTLLEQFDLTPYAIVLIPAGSLPKTSSGKTRRRQCREDFLAGRLNVLRAWKADGGSATDPSAAQEPPQTDLEQKLAALWCAVLGVEKVSRQADFFALGAQSLRASQLAARIRDELGAELPLRTLFAEPTLAAMASAIETALAAQPPGEAAPGTAAAPIPHSAEAGPHPLAFSQLRLWFLEQLGVGASHVSVALRLAGPLEILALEAAWGDVVARHEMLRARFFAIDGQPYQAIADGIALPLDNRDLTHLAADERERELAQLLATWSGRPFNLGAAPLARAGLVRLGEEAHVLSLTMHHLIADGWSAEVLLRDLAIAYAARQGGDAPAWTAPPVRFVDYARWRRNAWTEDRQAKALAYWRRRLADVPPLLGLPTDRPRTAEAPAQPAATLRCLPQDLAARIEALARQHGATPFVVHLAAWQVVLSRYAGRDDVCVGTAVAGRPRPELEHTVGCFINTVALRGDLAGDPPFRELLDRTRDAVLADLEHADAPFEKVVEAIQPQRQPGALPLVQALLLQQAPTQPLRQLGDAAVIASETDYSGLAAFDVSLVLEPHGQEWRTTLAYDRRRFDEATIAAMLDAYVGLLEHVAEDPDRRLSQLPIPSAGERRQLLETWNGAEGDVPAAEGFHALFETQAGKTPHAIAVEQGQTAWTYREVNDRADRIADALRHVGVGPQTPVGVCLSRRPELVAALLGVAKAGGAYVPLDPEYPAARLAFMIDDCAMPVVVTEAALSATLPACEAFVLELEELFPATPDSAASHAHDGLGDDFDRPEIAPRKDDSGGAPADRPAYIIYTSGSTGTPKGVAVPHRAVVNFLTAMAREPGLAARDAVLAATTVSFDIAVLELFLPLSVGAKIVLADRATLADGGALADLIAARGVNVMQATPAMYRLLLSAGWRPAPGMKLLVGGEALSADLAARLLRDDGELWNLYGPTETTVWSAAHRVTEAVDPIPIGRPILNTRFYVLDGRGLLAPRGAVGELYIGGAGVALGYWKRDDLTAERFVADPFGGDTPVYKTGDLVRWRSDGVLEFLGRADTQVKIRGFRIELGEIEAVLARHPAVREAAVVAPADERGERRLAAYYAPRGASPRADEVRTFLGDALPAYMVPTALVELPELPRTPAGKIDRRALPALEDARLAVSSPWVAPRTPLEEEIAAVWREVLKRDRIGVEDSFFELGGHSLLAAQVAARLRERLRAEFPLREFYRRPTIAALADAIVRQQVEDNQGQRIAALLDRLESLSDEAAAALLDEIDLDENDPT